MDQQQTVWGAVPLPANAMTPAEREDIVNPPGKYPSADELCEVLPSNVLGTYQSIPGHLKPLLLDGSQRVMDARRTEQRRRGAARGAFREVVEEDLGKHWPLVAEHADLNLSVILPSVPGGRDPHEHVVEINVPGMSPIRLLYGWDPGTSRDFHGKWRRVSWESKQAHIFSGPKDAQAFAIAPTPSRASWHYATTLEEALFLAREVYIRQMMARSQEEAPARKLTLEERFLLVMDEYILSRMRTL